MKCPVHCARYNQCVDPLYARHFLLCMTRRQLPSMGQTRSLSKAQHRLQVNLHMTLGIITIGPRVYRGCFIYSKYLFLSVFIMHYKKIKH